MKKKERSLDIWDIKRIIEEYANEKMRENNLLVNTDELNDVLKYHKKLKEKFETEFCLPLEYDFPEKTYRIKHSYKFKCTKCGKDILKGNHIAIHVGGIMGFRKVLCESCIPKDNEFQHYKDSKVILIQSD